MLVLLKAPNERLVYLGGLGKGELSFHDSRIRCIMNQAVACLIFRRGVVSTPFRFVTIW